MVSVCPRGARSLVEKWTQQKTYVPLAESEHRGTGIQPAEGLVLGRLPDISLARSACSPGKTTDLPTRHPLVARVDSTWWQGATPIAVRSCRVEAIHGRRTRNFERIARKRFWPICATSGGRKFILLSDVLGVSIAWSTQSTNRKPSGASREYGCWGPFPTSAGAPDVADGSQYILPRPEGRGYG